MGNLAQLTDLALSWRELTPAEVDRADNLIRFASAYVRDEIPGVDARVASGALQADTVAGVVVAMVQRAMMNADGVRTVSETIDNYQESRTFDTAVSSGELRLTDAERDRLAGRSGVRGGAASVAMGSADPLRAAYASNPYVWYGSQLGHYVNPAPLQ